MRGTGDEDESEDSETDCQRDARVHGSPPGLGATSPPILRLDPGPNSLPEGALEGPGPVRVASSQGFFDQSVTM